MTTSRILLAALGLTVALLAALLSTHGSRPGAGATAPDAPEHEAAQPVIALREAPGAPAGAHGGRRPIARSLSGRVIDAACKAVERARVRCGEAEAFTDDAGRFRLEPDAGIQHLSVIKQGYLPLEELVAPRAEDVGDLVLRRVSFVVEGRVLDPDRRPAAGARVRVLEGRFLGGATRDALLDMIYRPPGPAPAAIAETTADAEGAFRFEFADHVGQACVEAVSDAGEGRRSIEAGRAEERVFVVLDLTEVAVVHGRVVDAAGGGLAGLPVVVAPLLSDQDKASDVLAWRRSTTSGPDGRFRVYGVPLCAATLAVCVPDGPRELVRFQPPFGTELTVVVSGGGELVGTVLDAETRRPVLGAALSALAQEHGSSRVTWVTGQSDAAGHFRLRGLPPGPVETLIVRHAEHPPVGTMLGGSLRVPVVLAPPARSEPLEVLLPKGADFEVVVRAPLGHPVGGARVRLDGHGTLVRAEARTDALGQARFRGLLPGFYLLDVETTAGALPVEARLVEVQREAAPFLVDLVQGARAVGRVVTASDTPLVGVSVVLRTLAQTGLGSVSEQAAFSDTDGRFAFSGLAPGSVFEVEAKLPGRVGSTVVGLVEQGGQVVDVGSIAVLDGAEVLGRVIDQDGLAVAGAEVHLLRPLSPASPPASTWTGAEGTFAFVGLDPGRVQPVVTLAGHPPSIHPTFVLASGERRTELLLTVPRGEVLHGSVLDDRGAVVMGAEVSVRWVPLTDDGELIASGPMHTKKLQLFCEQRAVTTPEGTFRLQGLPNDRPLQLRVLAGGFAPAQEIVQPLALRGTGEAVVRLHAETDS